VSHQAAFYAPFEVVVLPYETTTPALRAWLRLGGFCIPPVFARVHWGPAIFRVARESQEPLVLRGLAPQGSAPPSLRSGGLGEEQGGYDDANSSVSTGAFQPVANSLRGGGAKEASTMQIDYDQANALARGSRGPLTAGDNTAQAAHRTERLDLSDWGFLLRVVLIADEQNHDPVGTLDRLRPTIGTWLHNEIPQPSRLEYDRRFRRDVEKGLARFLSETIGRFPIINVDIQFIE